MSKLQFAGGRSLAVCATRDDKPPCLPKPLTALEAAPSDSQEMNAPPAKTVAILGASPKPDRYAYKALELLHEYGHRTLPINPAFKEILGEKCYPTIA
jgi:CoA binding domain